MQFPKYYYSAIILKETVNELLKICYQLHNINFFYNPITPKKATDEFDPTPKS